MPLPRLPRIATAFCCEQNIGLCCRAPREIRMELAIGLIAQSMAANR